MSCEALISGWRDELASWIVFGKLTNYFLSDFVISEITKGDTVSRAKVLSQTFQGAKCLVMS